MGTIKPQLLAGFFVYRHLGLLECNIVLMKRFLPLLIVFNSWDLNAQVALPTFQGVHIASSTGLIDDFNDGQNHSRWSVSGSITESSGTMGGGSWSLALLTGSDGISYSVDYVFTSSSLGFIGISYGGGSSGGIMLKVQGNG